MPGGSVDLGFTGQGIALDYQDPTWQNEFALIDPVRPCICVELESSVDFMPILSGLCLLEAPRADADNVWFSEMALGGIRRLRPDGQVDAWLTDRKMIGGIVINDDGLLLCSGTGGIVWFDPATGATGTVLDKINNNPISGVNDMIADGKGGLYFGTVDHARMFRGEVFFGHSALYRLGTDGRVQLLIAGLKFSNGIGLSPDDRHLYINDSSAGTFAYEILPDGGLARRRLLSDRTDCDGLAVDCEGGVWIAQIETGTITRILPDGKVDREIPVNAGHLTSLCFGGPDGRDVFVTTAAEGAGAAVVKQAVPELRTAALYHARTDVAGLPLRRSNFRFNEVAAT
jgi:sugar lactone lactonase YvrE